VHFSAPVVHAAPIFRGSSVAHYSAPSRPQYFSTQVRPQYHSPSVIANSRSAATFTPFVTHGRSSFVQTPKAAPSIAFGGSTSGFRGSSGGNNLTLRAPGNVSRGWDRGHIHTWNHHHYRWWNGDWVLFDAGDYGYPYGYYGDDQPYFNYSSPGYSYDYSSGDTLVAEVQNQLTSLGYVTGPSDGEMGPLTQNALANFQRDHNLPITGQIDGMTMRALGLQ